MIFDGDCGFCRGWVTRWQRRTADRVDFAPFQEAAAQFPEVPIERFQRAVQLVAIDGSMTQGANAVFQILRVGAGPSWPSFLYRHMPGFAWITERGYRFVATHRPLVSGVTRILWGDHSREPSHVVTRTLFLRLLGLVYLIAFLSLGTQVIGLVGEHGVAPAHEYLSAVKTRLGDDAVWRVPTLCWFNHSDAFLRFLCYGGAGLSTLLILGVAPTPILALLWIFYLSLTAIGDVFLRFQWDMLLLETGFLAIFFGPLRLLSRPSREPEPSRIMLWLLRWLLFRLMLLSGLVKLWSGDDTWTGLTALHVHYETQPLPTWTSWYAHHLPDAFQKASLVIMFAVELVCPFLIFGPRRVRTFAAIATIGLMAAIGLTGNYTFFNLLTVALCIPLLDDPFLRRFAPRRAFAWLDQLRPRARFLTARRIALCTLAGVVVLMTTLAALARIHGLPGAPPRVTEVVGSTLRSLRSTAVLEKLRERTSPFRSANAYGLFQSMTTERDEIILEGSADGLTWKEYEFRWKPGDLLRAPAFVQPHQPRVDWQMWFAALGTVQRDPWFGSLMRRVQEGVPDVLAFFETNPFPDRPPAYLRATLYRYRFTDAKTRSETGAWWTRERLRPYAPTLFRQATPTDK